MDFSRFSTVSFDCYGTLIDWEAGILPVLRSLQSGHGANLDDATLLELYGEFEAEEEAGAHRCYKEVLQGVVQRFAERLGVRAQAHEIGLLAESVPAWPPFPDTVDALRRLKTRYKIAVISNIDDDLFAATSKLLGVQFDAVITAQQARSYKPSLNNFHLALKTLNLPPAQLLHAAQSVYHDVVPASSLGISTVWVNRKSARPGVGAVKAAAGKPDLEVPDLTALAALVGT